ncbi:MAG: glycosyltransferase family 2 protein [Methylococcaceae bacterium]|nr:glycosyltransferase family 2 protein [Methylococcaceae bacterium]
MLQSFQNHILYEENKKRMSNTLPVPSQSHLVVIPSYNTGKILQKTVEEAIQLWAPVWVIIDGSTDDSVKLLQPLVDKYSGNLKVIELEHNVGKGAAILHAILLAQKKGYTHVLTMDADHQHPAEYIAEFMRQSKKSMEVMIFGQPVFDQSAPAIRVQGRKISNSWVNLETLSWDIKDSLFGMRVYPINDLIKVMQSTRWARRFDFEPEVAVRMAWHGVKTINIETPVRYLLEEEGGVSQFRYLRDNILLTWMHIRLFFGFVIRLPYLLFNKTKK